MTSNKPKSLRILVVDDAIVVRRVLSAVLADDPAISEVHTAPNGRVALQKFTTLRPDAVVLDVEMPVMDGITTLRELRKLDTKVPIVMFSTLTERGAAATLEALANGASDYVTKPSASGGIRAAQERIRGELIPKLKALCRVEISPRVTRRLPLRAQPATKRPPLIDVVLIGVSTGGPNALAQVIPSLPADLPVPVLIVQHMPPVFTKMLADRLNAKAKLRVVEASHGDQVTPGGVWIAPGDYHMTVARQGRAVHVRLNQDPPVNFCRPAVDVLFRSAVPVYGGRILAVVLTGMGSDGCRGCQLIKEANGYVIAQDESTSVVWGMPGAVVQHDLADEVLPLQEIGPAIARLVQPRRAAPATANRAEHTTRNPSNGRTLSFSR